MLKKTSTLTIILSISVLLIGLGLLAYIGFYNRYWGDDWCYNLDFKNLGSFGALKGYFFTGDAATRGYSTNRYSLTLLSGLLYLPGIFGTQVLATLIILLWLGALSWIGFSLSRLHRPIPTGLVFLAAAFLLYFDLYLAPQRFQILYWRSGVHYSFSIIMGLYMLGLILSQAVKEHPGRLANFLMAPLAFLAGGLSETGCAYLVTATVLLLAIAWYARRKQARWAIKSYNIIWVALISLLAALIALIVSPSNDRLGTMAAKPTSFLRVPFLAFEFSFNFIRDSLTSLPIPHFVFVLFFAALAVLFRFLVPTDREDSWKRTGLFLLVTAGVAFLLIAAVQAPAIRFYSAPPDPRGQSLSRFTMLAGLAVLAWSAGGWLYQLIRGKWMVALAVVVLLGGTAYTARLILANYAELPEYQYRAQLWDQRNSDIQAARAQGITQMGVLVIDTHGIGVQDIMRSRDMNGKWVSTCGSEYYGLTAIKAGHP